MWMCRTWIETTMNGWVSEFDRFETEEEAEKHGEIHMSLIKHDEKARDYEVYFIAGEER